MPHDPHLTSPFVVSLTYCGRQAALFDLALRGTPAEAEVTAMRELLDEAARHYERLVPIIEAIGYDDELVAALTTYALGGEPVAEGEEEVAEGKEAGGQGGQGGISPITTISFFGLPAPWPEGADLPSDWTRAEEASETVARTVLQLTMGSPPVTVMEFADDLAAAHTGNTRFAVLVGSEGVEFADLDALVATLVNGAAYEHLVPTDLRPELRAAVSTGLAARMLGQGDEAVEGAK